MALGPQPGRASRVAQRVHGEARVMNSIASERGGDGVLSVRGGAGCGQAAPTWNPACDCAGRPICTTVARRRPQQPRPYLAPPWDAGRHSHRKPCCLVITDHLGFYLVTLCNRHI